eukprot:TRINITY_DN20628_c0_g1_i2.p1 TRINITY_DN20628_c0_g1~~TRINITY_DN20628_c0_g1_i2.p1  ORF type:complete len:476 (-),score=53.56 TRINITY_DN20628_c0_g1_i2:354-1781(-)
MIVSLLRSPLVFRPCFLSVGSESSSLLSVRLSKPRSFVSVPVKRKHLAFSNYCPALSFSGVSRLECPATGSVQARSISRAFMAESHIPGAMTTAVIGAGVAGLVCARKLADAGIPVSLFDMGRYPGGRMSQRRDRRTDGDDLLFDHGAQYFTIKDPAAQSLVDTWQTEGSVAEWEGVFGTFDATSKAFSEDEKERDCVAKKRRWVGVPGMHSMCTAMSQHPGVKSRFGVIVSGLKWQEGSDASSSSWLLRSREGEELGAFHSVIVAAAYKTYAIDIPAAALEIQEALRSNHASPCFALMLAFPRRITEVPFDGALITGSDALSWMARDSSKPMRKKAAQTSEVEDESECWVVHSTPQFATAAMAGAPPGRPSPEFLAKVAEDMLAAVRSCVGGELPTPIYMRAHRWGGAFPLGACASKEDRCLLDTERRLAVCGDFCVGPRVESAILSGLAAAERMKQLLQPGLGAAAAFTPGKL